jgi:hypothetical protein
VNPPFKRNFMLRLFSFKKLFFSTLFVMFTNNFALAASVQPLEYNGETYNTTTITGTYSDLVNSYLSVTPWYTSRLSPFNLSPYNFSISANSAFPEISQSTPLGIIDGPFLGIVNQDSQGNVVAGFCVYNLGEACFSDISIFTEGNWSGPFTWLVLFSGPSADDTLASMQPNASAMKNAFNRQYSQLAYGLNHDCTIFDANNICVSVFGRQTNMSDSSYDSSAAGLVLAYKPHAQFRMGAYIDQTMSNDTTAGVELERSNPDFGVFGVWNQQADGTGLQLRAAANYGKRDINVSRMVVGDSSAEAGRGKSDLNAYGALFEASYAFALNDMWSAKPYAGVRYLSIKRDSYSESMTDDVANPLSYAGLEQETTSAIAGIRLNGQLTPKVIASMNVGIEHDLDHSIDDYRATGVDDLGRINMDSQEDKTRPTAGLGLSYDVAEKQRISAAVQYRKEIFMSESSTTGQITYTIGF